MKKEWIVYFRQNQLKQSVNFLRRLHHDQMIITL